MATDGLWDFFSSDEVVNLVKNYPASGNTASLLITDVLRTAMIQRKMTPTPAKFQELISFPGTSRRKVYDDVTIIVVKLKVN